MNERNIPTVILALVIGLAAIIVLSGAIVVVVRPSSLSFHDYIIDLTILAGALGIGAGLGGTALVRARHPNEGAKDGD